MTDPLVRHARPDDRQAAIDVLVEAFRADPMMALIIPEAGAPHLADESALRRMMEVEVDRHVVVGHSYVVDDRGAALWTPPGVDAAGDEFGALMGELMTPEIMEQTGEKFAEMMAWKPEEPHFYLHMIGASDRARGQGLGSAMLRRVLEMCDREAHPAYLEASTARSAALYARHGFEELDAIVFTEDAVLRPMLRRPQ